jgi:hypothetical protein
MSIAHPVRSLPPAVRLHYLPPAIVTTGLIVIGIPLFLRMPVWCDITLYDLAARNLIRGGMHYRDLFDTNTPGYVWLLTVIRSVVGWSSESLRAVDLLIFVGVVFVLDRLTKQGGASGLNRLWMAAGCVGFYLFTEEQVHAQRDVWLALPALLAVSGRLKRITDPRPGVFRPAFAEGLLWAAAVWIKPHFLLVAVAVWLLTVRRLAGGQPRPWRATALDLIGNLAAGSLLGAAGVGHLMLSGTWPQFVEVMTVWNVGYMEGTFDTLDWRLDNCLGWFPPWSFLLPPTVLLAVVGLLDARIWSGRFRPPEEGGLFTRVMPRRLWHLGGTDQERYTRAVLGGVYLVWAAQSLFLQRAFVYAHAIEVMLMLAAWATHRRNLAALVFAWLVVVELAWAVAPGPLVQAINSGTAEGRMVQKAFTPHPAFDRGRARRWAGCFRPLTGAAYWERQDALRHETFHASGIGWAELYEVAEFLRGQQVKDHELVTWDDAPHPLYLILDIEPGIRFVHINTVRGINDGIDKIVAEMRANPAVRFVVVDLQWYWFQIGDAAERERFREPGPAADDLLPPAARRLKKWWPFNTELSVFRSGGCRGRYVVFAVK